MSREKLKMKQVFLHKDDGCHYMITRSVHKTVTIYSLISLSDGLTWAGSYEYIDEIFDGDREEFERVTEPVVLTPQ